MTNYEAPKVLLTNSGEGPYGNSGAPDPNVPTATIVWTNHNSGSHSDLEIKVRVPYVAEKLVVKATWNGKGNITSIGGYGFDPNMATWDGKTLTIIRYGHINKDEGISLSFNNVVFDSTGDDHNTDIWKGSYYEGQKPELLGLPAYEFLLDVSAT